MSVPTRTDRLRLAEQAHERALALAAEGNKAEARRWLERACRLLPHDDTLALALATACLGQDDAKAAALFANLAARHDRREVWAGLAIARRHTGDLEGAAAAVSHALARLVPDSTLASVADLVVRHGAARGWCAISADGAVDVHVIETPSRIELQIDGQRPRPIATGRCLIPPAQWRSSHEVHLTADGIGLLGSPIQAHLIRRVEGCVSAHDGALTGWAWWPADPTINPEITVTAGNRRHLTLVASDETDAALHAPLLGRPRSFRLEAPRLAGMTGPLRVCGPDGMDLFGSPIDPAYEQHAAIGVVTALSRNFPAGRKRASRAAASPPFSVPADINGPARPVGLQRRRPVADVVITVHGGGDIERACLKSVLATLSPPSRVVVVDDATPDRGFAAELAALAGRRRIRLIRHVSSQGYPASANAGIRACAGRDVVLLNSDTIVTPDWLTRLREIAYAAPNIGTVSPISNNATILSYPCRDEANAMPDAAEAARLSRLAHRANHGATVDIPVAVGSCMYLRRDCLNATGAFREDVFAQGYGEENDFCLRARHLGWRHVAAPGVFVAHHGAGSFGAAGKALRGRNQLVLNRLHPGHTDLIVEHLRNDPLAPARRRLDQARWRAVRPSHRAAVLLITHREGGGVEQRIVAACDAHRDAGLRPIVLRPSTLADGTPAAVLGDGVEDGFPNLGYALPMELAVLARFLRGAGLRAVELHHLLGHHRAILSLLALLDVPYDVHVHDYALICPRILLVGRERRYCGEPAVATCEACIADLGSASGETITVAALRWRSARLLAGARRVLTPSEDAAFRLRRHFPNIDVRAEPPSDDANLSAPIANVPRRDVARICVVGAIGVQKGYDILLACARDAVERNLPLEFVVVGHTIDDARLLDTGRVFITGEFQPSEAVELIQAQEAALAWLPSVWPETWCFTLSEAWSAGLRVAAFDLGAQAERIRATGRGVVLPLGLPPSSINSVLLAEAGLSDHQ